MRRQHLCNCLLLDPEAPEPRPGSLLVEAGRIAARLAPDSATPASAARIDLAGRALAPGFLDLHYHGAMVFRDSPGLSAALARDAASLLRHGTTGFLATTVAEPAPQLEARLTALARAVGESRAPGAAVLGIHLEGPWISPAAAGAQPPRGMRGFEPREGEELLRRAEGLVRLVTLAPEVEGAPALLEWLVTHSVIAALGHSLADAAQLESAVRRGARHVTHLFNAMGDLHHRRSGLAVAALADDRLSCDLICDGVHVDPLWTRIAARAKRDGLLLITDRVEPAEPGSASGFGSGPLRREGGAWRLSDGRLAGSCLTLDASIRNAQAFGALTRLEAVAACTLRPARLLGIEAQRGSLRVGACADFAVLDVDDRVVETWIAGRRVFPSDALGAAGP